jgi:hypothetical protein
MRTILKLTAAVLLLGVAARPAFALWGLTRVTKADAKEMGIEIRTTPAGPNDVRVEMEFKIEGHMKAFSSVDLRVGDGEKVLTASLKEDRTQPGRVVVSFSADRTQLDKAMLWIMVPGTLGGTIYEVRVKDFVEVEKGR